MTKSENMIQNGVTLAIAIMFGVAIYIAVNKQLGNETRSSACGCGA